MSVTYPLGFRAGGIQAGLRTTPGLDLALIVNDGPADVVAGVFTTNRVCAAPVQWSRHATADHKARAVIVNAAVANACTGIDGFADCVIGRHAGIGVNPTEGDVTCLGQGILELLGVDNSVSCGGR